MEEDVQQINVDNSSSSNLIIDHPHQLITRPSSTSSSPPPPPTGGAASAPPPPPPSSAQPALISSFLTHHPHPPHLHSTSTISISNSNPNPNPNPNPNNPFLPLSSFSSRQISTTYSLNPTPPPQPINSAPPNAASDLADHSSPSAKRGKYVNILAAQWPLIPSLPISASAAAAAQLGGGGQPNLILNPNITSATAGGGGAGYNSNAPQLAVSPPSGPISSASAHSFSQSSSPSSSAVKTATMQGMSASSGGGGGRGAQSSAVGSPSVSQSASQSTMILPYPNNRDPSNNLPPSHATMGGGDAGGALQVSVADQPSSTTAEGGGRSSVRKGKFVSPVWKPMEMLALAKAWRIQYSGASFSKAETTAGVADQSSTAAAAAATSHKAKTRAEKDWEVAEYLKQEGVQRDMKTAATKWDNMLGDFRRVHEWEKGPEREEAAALTGGGGGGGGGGGKSYFCLSSAERKQYRLPASFDEDVYEEMIQYVGHRPRSIGVGGGGGGGGHRGGGGGGRGLGMSHNNLGPNSGAITLSDYHHMGGSGAMVAVYNNSGASNLHCRSKHNLTEGLFGSSGGGGAAHRALLIEGGEGGGGSLEQSPAAQEASNNSSMVNRVMAAGGGSAGFMASSRMKRVGRVKMVWEESVQLWAEETDTYYMNAVNHPATAITAATPTAITPPPQAALQDHPMSHHHHHHHLISSNHHSSSHGMMMSTHDLYGNTTNNNTNSSSHVSQKLNQEQGSQNNNTALVRNIAASSPPPPPPPSSSSSSLGAVAGRLKVESVSFLNADELVFLDESLTGNAIEVFEAGRLRGFSTHTFTPGQVIKVFGRRMNTTPPLTTTTTPPPPPPPSNLFSNLSSPPPPPQIINSARSHTYMCTYVYTDGHTVDILAMAKESMDKLSMLKTLNKRKAKFSGHWRGKSTIDSSGSKQLLPQLPQDFAVHSTAGSLGAAIPFQRTTTTGSPVPRENRRVYGSPTRAGRVLCRVQRYRLPNDHIRSRGAVAPIRKAGGGEGFPDRAVGRLRQPDRESVLHRGYRAHPQQSPEQQLVVRGGEGQHVRVGPEVVPVARRGAWLREQQLGGQRRPGRAPREQAPVDVRRAALHPRLLHRRHEGHVLRAEQRRAREASVHGPRHRQPLQPG